MPGPWDKFAPITIDPNAGKAAAGPWQNFNPTDSQVADFQAKQPQKPTGFFGTLAEDAGQFIPNLAHTAMNLARHPINTAGSMARSFANLPDTLGDEYQTDPGKAVAHLVELAGPKILESGGKLLQAGARPLVKSALGLPGKAEAYGATPAKAVLEETSGVRPASIAASAQNKIGDLSSELEKRAAGSSTPASLVPARNVIARDTADAAAANSKATPRELSPMLDQLTTPRPGFAGDVSFPSGSHTPITIKPPAGFAGTPTITRGAAPTPLVSPEQSPLNLIKMKRQFDNDFITNWNPESGKGTLATARKAYGAMADEVNRTVPGAEDLNQRISSLIPAAQRAKLTDLSAGPTERVLNRVSRPTGALVAPLAAFHAGGIPGLITEITGQEMLSSPVAKMIAARGAFGAGKAGEFTGQAAAPLVMARKPENR